MNRLENKIALITGASSGIGAETAKLFVKEGAKVIIADINDEKGILLSETLGKNAVYFHLDVSVESEWISIMQYIEENFKKLDILFNNAGIMRSGNFLADENPEDTSLKEWKNIHKINLESVFLGCKYGIKFMKKSGGSIINMSSRSGIVGVPHAAAYSSSKAAVRNYSKTVALYCAEKKYNIRCNSIHPAAILTPIWDSILGTTEHIRQKSIQNIESGIPLGKMGSPIDVAYAVLYLASDESKYITGTEIIIDGGILAGSNASPSIKKE